MLAKENRENALALCSLIRALQINRLSNFSDRLRSQLSSGGVNSFEHYMDISVL